MTELGKSANTQPFFTDYVKNKVYLYQFGRERVIPSGSPFCLKLETWLRMAGINYENLEGSILTNRVKSREGKLPFIELNGEQFGDSDFIIRHLSEHFKIDTDGQLSAMDNAHARCMQGLLDDMIFFLIIYYRRQTVDTFLSDEVQGALPWWVTTFKPLAKYKICTLWDGKMDGQGIGRRTPAEVEFIGKECIDTFSTILGQKQYLFGDKPTVIDASAFGHLAQFYWVPPETPLSLHFKTKMNLVDYVERIKTAYWHDWNSATKGLQLNTPEMQQK